MKNLYYIIVLLASASLYAMDIVRIEPFQDKYLDAATDIFQKTLPDHAYPAFLHSKLSGKEEPFLQTCNLLIKYATAEAIEKKDDGILVGFIIDRVEESSYRTYFLNFLSDQKFGPYRKEHAQEIADAADTLLKYNHILWLCIHPDHHRKGYGKLLMQHIEQEAEQKKHSLIDLYAVQEARPFYDKSKYLPKDIITGRVVARAINAPHLDAILHEIDRVAHHIQHNQQDDHSRPVKKLKRETPEKGIKL